MPKVTALTLLFLSLLCTSALAQTSYFVSTTGVDDPARDGLSAATAWASLSFACEQLPGRFAFEDTINIAAGTYIVGEAALLKPGLTVQGAGMDQTILRTDQNWTMLNRPNEPRVEDYIIALSRFEQGYGGSDETSDVIIRDLRLESTLTNLTNGGIYLRDVQDALIENVHFEDFAWSGINLVAVERIEVRDCYLENANRIEDDFFGGNIYTRVVRDSKFHHNTFRNTVPGERQWGVGYKGGFHINTEINDNDFSTGSGFDIEIPFEQNYGVRIFNNIFNRTVSVPKNNNGEPFSRGFDYSMWIYDNYFTNGYDIEGTRGYMRISGNFFDVQNINGRCYSAFGNSTSNEPQWIYNNVAVGVDRSFIWINGRVDSVNVWNNTIYYEDADNRAAAMIDIQNTNVGWDVRNNLFVSPDVQPRPMGAGIGGQNVFTNNLVINATNASLPTGNFRDMDPGLQLSGDAPNPFYTPIDENSFVVDRGVDVGLPFEGAAPDIGAFEFSGAALPIELLSFTGEATDKTAELHWTVANARAFSHFEVEDLKTGATSFGGGALNVSQVQFEMEEQSFELSLPWEGNLKERTFRLRMVDVDGTVRLSDALTLRRSADLEALSVYPNPTTEQLSFTSEAIGAYRIYTADGKLVNSGAVRSGTNSVAVANLTKGTYQLVVIDRRGAIKSAQFIK